MPTKAISVCNADENGMDIFAELSQNQLEEMVNRFVLVFTSEISMSQSSIAIRWIRV